MLARSLATLAGALALSGVLASTASAATSANVKPLIQGAGTVTGYTGAIPAPTCTQDRGISELSVHTCPDWWTASHASKAVDLYVLATPESGWKFDRWEDCDLPVVRYCVTRARAGESRYGKPKAIFKDIEGPQALNLTAKPSTSEDRAVTGTWDASEPGAIEWKCSTDTIRFVDCASPYTVQLPEGGHSLTVYGTDVNGHDGLKAKIPVTIVDTELTTAPAQGSTVTTSASPWVARTGHGTTFECSLNGRPFDHCGTPGADGTAALTVPVVADGTHTLRVRARRGAAVDAVPATRTWTVDTKPRTPAPTPTPIPTPQSGGGSAAPQPTLATQPPLATQPAVAPATVQAAPKKIAFRVRYTFRKGRFTKLVAEGVPAETKLLVTVKRPGKRAAKTTLARLVGKRLKPGTKITVRAGTAKKVITIRRARAPRIG